jgi:hypothetical protein
MSLWLRGHLCALQKGFDSLCVPLCPLWLRVLGFQARGRNSLARVWSPRVKGGKTDEPQRGVIIEPRPSGLGTESNRNPSALPKALAQRGARSDMGIFGRNASAKRHGKIDRSGERYHSGLKSRSSSLGHRDKQASADSSAWFSNRSH